MNNTNETALPKKTLMRKSLTMHNPPLIKSSDGLVYKKTGNVVDDVFVRPKGTVSVPLTGSKDTGYDVLKSFSPIMDKKLREKGIMPPSSMEDKAKLFYNHVVAAKGFAGAKPMNFEAYDHADPQVQPTVLSNVLTYFKSLATGVQPDGTPLSTQDQILSKDVKGVVQNLAAKVSNAGLSPEDTAALGGHLSGSNPATDNIPIYKQPIVKYGLIGIAVLILLIIITR